MTRPRCSRTIATGTHIGKDVPDEIAYPLACERMLKRRRITECGCWEWTGYVMPNGYAEMSIRSKAVRIHRLSYLIHKGPIPDGLDILHSCDNKICFNPEHLSTGTNARNVQETVERGQHGKIQNTHCPSGHAFVEHGYLNPKTGWRACKTCARIRGRIKAGWPEELARSEPPRQGRSPIANPTWQRAPKGRPVKTHCFRGHELAGENLYRAPSGKRHCRACRRDAAIKRWKPSLAASARE